MAFWSVMILGLGGLKCPGSDRSGRGGWWRHRVCAWMDLRTTLLFAWRTGMTRLQSALRAIGAEYLGAMVRPAELYLFRSGRIRGDRCGWLTDPSRRV